MNCLVLFYWAQKATLLFAHAMRKMALELKGWWAFAAIAAHLIPSAMGFPGLNLTIGQRGRPARPVNSWMVEKAFILVSA
jgi:hypothetical protein